MNYFNSSIEHQKGHKLAKIKTKGYKRNNVHALMVDLFILWPKVS